MNAKKELETKLKEQEIANKKTLEQTLKESGTKLQAKIHSLEVQAEENLKNKLHE
jgi:hypothetical protein